MSHPPTLEDHNLARKLRELRIKALGCLSRADSRDRRGLCQHQGRCGGHWAPQLSSTPRSTMPARAGCLVPTDSRAGHSALTALRQPPQPPTSPARRRRSRSRGREIKVSVDRQPRGTAQRAVGTRGLRQGQTGSRRTQGNPTLELPAAGNSNGTEGIALTSSNHGALVEGSNGTLLGADWRELGHDQPCREPQALME